MIDKNSPIPIYHQLEEHIRELIEAGQLIPGDALPSEREYAELYGISRMTVRQAITNLVNDQLLYRIKGKGTFVMEKKYAKNTKGLTSFTEEMNDMGMKASTKLLDFKIIPANPMLANELGVLENSRVYSIKRIRLAEDIPMALETTYISADLIKGITARIAKRSLYDYIENTLQLKISNSSQVVEASIANPEELVHLEIPKNSPVLSIKQTAYLVNQTVLEVVTSSYRADRYKFMVDLKRS